MLETVRFDLFEQTVKRLVADIFDIGVTQRSQVALYNVLTLGDNLALDTEHVNVVFWR